MYGINVLPGPPTLPKISKYCTQCCTISIDSVVGLFWVVDNNTIMATVAEPFWRQWMVYIRLDHPTHYVYFILENNFMSTRLTGWYKIKSEYQVSIYVDVDIHIYILRGIYLSLIHI